MKALSGLACSERELSILFTDDRHISELNRDFRGKDGPTDVLAFPMSGDIVPDMESGMLGDIVISVDTAIQESEGYGEPLEETIYRLLIHGLLHLVGYDHERSEEDEKLMKDEEERLLALIRED